MPDDVQVERGHAVVISTVREIGEQPVDQGRRNGSPLAQIDQFNQDNAGNENNLPPFVRRRKDPSGPWAEAPASGPRPRVRRFLEVPQKPVCVCGVHWAKSPTDPEVYADRKP